MISVFIDVCLSYVNSCFIANGEVRFMFRFAFECWLPPLCISCSVYLQSRVSSFLPLPSFSLNFSLWTYIKVEQKIVCMCCVWPGRWLNQWSYCHASIQTWVWISHHPCKSQAWQYVSATPDRHSEAKTDRFVTTCWHQRATVSKYKVNVARETLCGKEGFLVLFHKTWVSFLFQCWQLRNACNSSSRGSNTLLWPQ